MSSNSQSRWTLPSLPAGLRPRANASNRTLFQPSNSGDPDKLTAPSSQLTASSNPLTSSSNQHVLEDEPVDRVE
ncbi:hypothetical protein GYMLUDRAFT_235981 [Collybiopsis luxurians FD-317 M1]|nr:hypothetical protein GYMLUDRAFT_235981 [Collybiopsis luxurians FD-317 M1]